MKKCIVTGANGFVGQSLIRKLNEENVIVYAIIKDENENIDSIKDFENVKIVYCDLADIKKLPEKILERDIDVFYHIAWISAGGSGRANYNIQLLNTKYACDCAEIAKKLNCKKFLCAGTITEKIAEDVLNLTVKSENIIYGISKHTAHCLLDIICQSLGLDYIWMQFSNLYGPHSINGNIVQYTIDRLLHNQTAEFGPANQPYDLLYIDDLAEQMYLLGKIKMKNNCYYLGSNTPMILKEYLLKIGDIMNKKNLILIGSKKDDGTRYNSSWFDISPLLKEIGTINFTNFEDGINNTINWIEVQNNAI